MFVPGGSTVKMILGLFAVVIVIAVAMYLLTGEVRPESLKLIKQLEPIIGGKS